MGHPAFQRQRVRFPHGIKGNGHGKAAIAADLYRFFALDLFAGVQQRGTGVFLIGEPVAANLHADKALCRERMRREGLHIRLQPTNKALVFFYLFREVFQQTVLQAELLAVVFHIGVCGDGRVDLFALAQLWQFRLLIGAANVFHGIMELICKRQPLNGDNGEILFAVLGAFGGLPA